MIYRHVDKLPGYTDLQQDLDEKRFIRHIRNRSQAFREEKLQDVIEKQQIVKGIARDFGVHVLDFPAMFDEAAKDSCIEQWIWDGVHPTVSGHMLMFRLWKKVCQQSGLLD